ncbi:bifunctional riboflavin kinase/FAD synthetase [Croceicoccus naphthovorans]|uniref:Riboflavin biosynthesis protein n=1 Tax=Croceicoccus naphthovorans TaxID=1348774 RepID=A0A0G3XCL9_9SPHN|nr:bifunctional riboflavin kinase/FAD synthetase [Croceicoccus naphthovorans]AKM08937.1 riboflavin biosynthesis protein RibF [Croceicoccus naphthovorans]MBB3989276.1 riboflavin kinase/FMN adenylyltransferase [Croceicoccus naphthovorans]
MTRLSSTDPIPQELQGAVIALGNFDGVHQGHQAVIGAAVDMARADGSPVLVATFDPHPARHFKPDAPPFRLTTLEQREVLFAAYGADAMVVFEFDAALAGTSAEDFVNRHLLTHMGVKGIVTGTDFTFGKDRSGNIDVMRRLAAQAGIGTKAVPPVHDGGGVISSTRIRQALQAGDPQEAARLLTRPFAIRGEVVHGAKLGRTIGYPTANVELGPYLRPKYGIYAVTGHLPDGRVIKGAANLGIRPSFDPPKELLEPYFFDFAEDLYGQTIEVALHHFLRPEAKFDTLDALTEQMEKDCAKARALLDALPAFD